MKTDEEGIKNVHQMAKQMCCIKDIETNQFAAKKRVLLSDDEEIQFEEVFVKMEEIMAKYKVSADRMMELMEKYSGSVFDVDKYLNGKKLLPWTDLEDMALRQPLSNEMCKLLLKTKGRPSMMKRKHFLQIN